MPALPPGLTYVEVAAGDAHTVARRSDGSVVAWGSSSFGQLAVPALPPGLTYVEVAAGSDYAVARRSDGLVVTWGDNRFGQLNVPELAPGMTFVQVSAGAAHTVAIVEPGSFATFAPGCPGSLGVPSLIAADPPRVGQAMSLTLQGLPASQATVLFGASNTSSVAGPLPISLSALGLPDCWLRVSPDVAIALSGAGSSATLTFSIPATPTLVGLSFHQEAVVPDPQAGRAGFVMSDAATGVVGP